MNFRKILGWVLLAAGLLIIFGGLYSSYNIFTAKSEAPKIFKFEVKPVAEVNSSAEKTLSPAEVQEQMGKMISEKLQEMMPPEFLAKLFNLISWSIFVGILVLMGGKLCTIGVSLIKE